MTIEDFSDRDGWIWQNGTLVPWRDAKVHVLTHTLHYGVGCFEGVRAYDTPNGPCIFRLYEHTRRLFNSAHILGLKIPYTPEEVNQAQLDVFKANELDEGYLRPMVYLGSEAMGLRAKGLSVNFTVAAWPWPDYLEPDSREKGIRVRTSSYTRHHVNITMCKAKANGNYINSGRTIGTGKRGPLTERPQSVYFDQVRGQRTSFRQWHTPVNGQAA